VSFFCSVLIMADLIHCLILVLIQHTVSFYLRGSLVLASRSEVFFIGDLRWWLFCSSLVSCQCWWWRDSRRSLATVGGRSYRLNGRRWRSESGGCVACRWWSVGCNLNVFQWRMAMKGFDNDGGLGSRLELCLFCIFFQLFLVRSCRVLVCEKL